MPRHGLREDDRGMTLLMKVIALLIAFGVVLAVYFGFFASKTPEAGPPSAFIEMNDVVRLSYIGYFENNLVFDTSISSVAHDNATYPKALSFQLRPSYSDFSFTVGKTDCSDGSSDCAIIGMTEAVLGLHEGDVRTANVVPEKGYGQKNEDLMAVKDMIEVLPVREVMNITSFQKRFKSVPVDGTVVQDPFWGWPALVHISGGLVTVENSPEIAKTYQLYLNNTKGGTWSVIVQGIDDGANGGIGAISILNRFTFISGNKLMVTDTSGDFYVTENDDETYTVDRNREVVGVNLIFQVNILQITKSS